MGRAIASKRECKRCEQKYLNIKRNKNASGVYVV